MAKKKEVSVAPLTGGFMIVSMLGFLISALWLLPSSGATVNPVSGEIIEGPNGENLPISKGWALSFMIITIMMFVASMISMTYGPVSAQLHVGGNRYKDMRGRKVKKKKKK